MAAHQTPLLLLTRPDDAHGDEGFCEYPLRRWDRLAARVWGWSLDAELAAGAPVESSARRAARARYLVDPARRATLAGYWSALVETAATRSPAAATPPRASAVGAGRLALPGPCYDRIRAAAPDLGEMVAFLRSPHPVPARGVAMASVLLTDGTGPVHYRANHRDLRAEARRVIHFLDPSTLLLGAD